jgi:hypothetical protein
MSFRGSRNRGGKISEREPMNMCERHLVNERREKSNENILISRKFSHPAKLTVPQKSFGQAPPVSRSCSSKVEEYDLDPAIDSYINH